MSNPLLVLGGIPNTYIHQISIVGSLSLTSNDSQDTLLRSQKIFPLRVCGAKPQFILFASARGIRWGRTYIIPLRWLSSAAVSKLVDGH